MKVFKQNRQLSIKRIFIRCVAVLFVIYALADITVLQAYCGNEAAGIPPSHHLSENKKDSIEKQYQVQAKQNNLHESHDREESPKDCGDDCCFCCSSHITLGSFVREPQYYAVTVRQASPLSRENKHSNSGFRYLFRPPRNA